MHHYVYYHCTKQKNPNCTQGVIEEKGLVAQIVAVLDSLEIPSEFHEFAMKWMEVENKKQSESTAIVIENIQKDYKNCLATIDGLIDMRARQELDEDNYKRRLSEAQKEKARLESLMSDTGGRVDGWIETANDVFRFAEYAKEKFKNGSPETQRAIFSTLGSNPTLKDRKLNIDGGNALLPMQKLAKAVKEMNEEIRTAKNPVTTKVIGQIYLEKTPLLRG